jgi:hypothetical protein
MIFLLLTFRRGVGRRIARGERFPRRLVDGIVVGVRTELSGDELRRLAERASGDAANEKRDATEHEQASDDATSRERERRERDASGDGDDASRATRAPAVTADCDDVEPLALLARRSSYVTAGMESTRPSRSERYAGRTSAGTGHADTSSNPRADSSSPGAEHPLGSTGLLRGGLPRRAIEPRG